MIATMAPLSIHWLVLIVVEEPDIILNSDADRDNTAELKNDNAVMRLAPDSNDDVSSIAHRDLLRL